ncbi:BatA domain-containing protein [Planctomicrobium sp. SH668]|uniref:BatA domain-containing protein n=1 Tax=Planctomicrobium sp. SH668 TaxID=3448126 RepID=UPI003F5B93BE
MSFLAPFYLLAGLAIGLPIAFHMIRRTPQGRKIFSSTMFLSPSPPRFARRSRIDDWLLLLLRAAAICLLAFAFARPFYASSLIEAVLPDVAKRKVFLLDRSASMQRTGYWDRAKSRLVEDIRNSDPSDVVSIQCFDSQVQTVLSFEDWHTLASGNRLVEVERRLSELNVGFRHTEAGKALIQVVDGMSADSNLPESQNEIVLISDVQLGGGWDVLHGTVWPENLTIRVIEVSEKGESNGVVQLARSEGGSNGTVRFRLTNAANSLKENFQIVWQDRFNRTDEQVQNSGHHEYVAPGQTLTLSLPESATPELTEKVVLSGDDVLFDNECFVAPPQQRVIRIAYLGQGDELSTSEGLLFFLQPLFPSDNSRRVQIIDWKESSSPTWDGQPIQPDWLIVGGTPDQSQLSWIKDFLNSGGNLLFVARNADQAIGVYDLLELPRSEVKEATVKQYALLGRVNLKHSVLRQFNDPRFSDFTKLRLWKYRQFLSDSFPNFEVLAAAEDGSPVISEIKSGSGTVVLFALGWNRDDSDFAVWSKFVPLMNSLLELAVPTLGQHRQMTVGESLQLSELKFESEAVFVQRGQEIVSKNLHEPFTFERTGLYRFAGTRDDLSNGNAVQIAVNLDPQESRTEPYSLDQLVSTGAPLQLAPAVPARGEQLSLGQQRQLLNRELESNQQWWRWIVVAGLVVLLLESILAAWKARRTTVLSTV